MRQVRIGFSTWRQCWMRTEGVDIDFRFIEDVQSIENIRRIVLRVSEGDITVIKSHDVYLRYYIELEGVSGEIDAWSCKVRRAESIAILNVMGNDFVRISKCSVFIPSYISDIEVHSSRGSIQIRDMPSNVLAITERGNIGVTGAKFVEASSVADPLTLKAAKAALCGASMACSGAAEFPVRLKWKYRTDRHSSIKSRKMWQPSPNRAK